METPGRVGQVAVPPAAQTLSTLSRVNYEDAFLLDIGVTRELTGEQWAGVTPTHRLVVPYLLKRASRAGRREHA